MPSFTYALFGYTGSLVPELAGGLGMQPVLSEQYYKQFETQEEIPGLGNRHILLDEHIPQKVALGNVPRVRL